MIAATQPTNREQDLIDLLFFFSRDNLNSRQRIGSPSVERSSQIVFTRGADPAVDEALLANFKAYAEVEAPGKFTTADWKSEETFIKDRLLYYFAEARNGATVANRLLLEDDPLVVRAMAAIPRARELAFGGTKNRLSTRH